MNVNDVSDFCALGLRLCHANPSSSISVEILLRSENILVHNSVALLTLGCLSFFFFLLSDLDCISRGLFAVKDCVMLLKLKWTAIITIFMAWVYISTKAWLGFPPVLALPVITKSSLIKHNPFSEELVSSPLPGPVLACDNTDKSMLGFLHIKADGGSGVGGCLSSFMSAGASEESDAFTRCSLLFLLAYKNL